MRMSEAVLWVNNGLQSNNKVRLYSISTEELEDEEDDKITILPICIVDFDRSF